MLESLTTLLDPNPGSSYLYCFIDMYLKLLSLTALASYVAAQEVQDLNATLWANNETSSLAAFLNQSPILIQALSEASNVTILAPNNEAFETLLNGTAGEELYSDPGLSTELLLYHILNGTYAASDITNTSTFIHTFSTNASYTNVTGGQVVQAVTIGEDVVFYSGMLQNATVITPDLNFSGGVIHVVDSVLTLPESAISTARSANLTSLAGALNSTDLIEAVDTAEDVTIFAPTNEAFQNIGSALADLSTEDLASILQYHVVSGTVGYSSMLENMALETLNGEDLTITIIDDTVFVNAARVVATDILVANGVVHIIDKYAPLNLSKLISH
ncbi:Fasciclin-domain-containing protein [Patellaria atrata CBS 101060]|uniref:Fasciclin-domain-containing protein n=1 Tax=Patellaria atrata CBS 101060 TaxID=1346257 RepID=A0A9P4SBD2_9PEZI|nr:Fasciclin-domain-containing protein [Patellaria atrata CBS 101060]